MGASLSALSFKQQPEPQTFLLLKRHRKTETIAGKLYSQFSPLYWEHKGAKYSFRLVDKHFWLVQVPPLLSQPPTKNSLILNKSEANTDQSAVMLLFPNLQETQTKTVSTACFHTWCQIISLHNITSTYDPVVPCYVAQLEILVPNYQKQLLNILERWYLYSTCFLADFLCIKSTLLGNVKNTRTTGKQIF